MAEVNGQKVSCDLIKLAQSLIEEIQTVGYKGRIVLSFNKQEQEVMLAWSLNDDCSFVSPALNLVEEMARQGLSLSYFELEYKAFLENPIVFISRIPSTALLLQTI